MKHPKWGECWLRYGARQRSIGVIQQQGMRCVCVLPEVIYRRSDSNNSFGARLNRRDRDGRLIEAAPQLYGLLNEFIATGPNGGARCNTADCGNCTACRAKRLLEEIANP